MENVKSISHQSGGGGRRIFQNVRLIAATACCIFYMWYFIDLIIFAYIFLPLFVFIFCKHILSSLIGAFMHIMYFLSGFVISISFLYL